LEGYFTMKKIAVLIFSTLMLFVIATSSLANSVSLGYLVNGECKTEGGAGRFTHDAMKIVLGGNYQINDKFIISSELTVCEIDASHFGGNTYDDFSYKLKGSYAIYQNDQVSFELSAGYLYLESVTQQVDSEHEYTSFTLGTDVTFYLAKKINISAGFEYGISPDSEFRLYDLKQDNDVDSLINYQMNCNYLITKQVSLSLGYSSSCWEFKDGDKVTQSGIITSVTYKF